MYLSFIKEANFHRSISPRVQMTRSSSYILAKRQAGKVTCWQPLKQEVDSKAREKTERTAAGMVTLVLIGTLRREEE